VAPIEVFFGAIVFIFALIGLARGFLRELGVTTLMMFLLFFLSRFEPYLDKGMATVLSSGGRFLPTQDKDLLQCWFFVLVVIGGAFVSYQGETLAFGGQSPRGAQGISLGLLTGALNGYLIAGTLWFYMHKFNYPIAFLGFSGDKLSWLAREMIPFLPVQFLGQPVLLGQSLLLYLSGLLLIARVIR
jgi:uncharacterized membrane protein required for colicin V production